MYPHERDVLPKIGPHFLLGSDGAVLFKFVVDTSNVLGPRVASAADKATHPEAWARFEREQREAEAATKADQKPPRLAELIAGMTLENRHPEVDFGPPVGREFPNEEPALKRRGRPPKAA